MVATASTQRFFTKADEKKEGEPDVWHAYRDDGTTALCGEAQLTYNVDSIADAVPASGVFHLACREALAVEQQPQAEAEAAAAAEAEAPADEGGESQTIGEGDVATINADAVIAETSPDNAEAEAQPTPEANPEAEVAVEPGAPPADVAEAEATGTDGEDGSAPHVEQDPPV